MRRNARNYIAVSALLTLVVIGTMVLMGQQVINPGGGGSGSGTVSANNGTAGAVAQYAAAGGSTTVGPSTDLFDPLTGIITVGVVGATNPGKTTYVGNTSGSQTIGCANATCNPMQVGGAFSVVGALSTQTSFAPTSAGHLTMSATAPTIGTCGTSPSVVANNGTVEFELNVGTGGTASTCGFTLPAASTGWQCNAVDITNPTTGGGYLVKQTSALSTTAVTLTGFSTAGAATAWTASDILLVNCHGF